MRAGLRRLTAIGLVVALVLMSGCKSVKQVKIPEERAAWLTYGALTANGFELSDAHLGGILGIAKSDYTSLMNALGIYTESDATVFLDNMLRRAWTKGELNGATYSYDDALWIGQQKLLPFYPFDEDDADRLRERYEAICDRLVSRYGYTLAQLDAIDTVSALDYDMLISWARILFALDLISEEDCWYYIEAASLYAAKDYDSWEDYAAGYALGGLLEGGMTEHEVYALLDTLLLDEQSPYYLHTFGV